MASSPGKNLTGSPRVARDIVADLFNTIQNWNDSHIKGAQVVKQIAELKADNIDEYSDELEDCTNNLYNLVQNLKLCSEQFKKFKSQISALHKIERKKEPLFISLNVGDIGVFVETVVNGYLEEIKVI